MWVDLLRLGTRFPSKTSGTVALCLTLFASRSASRSSRTIERREQILNEIVGFLDAD